MLGFDMSIEVKEVGLAKIPAISGVAIDDAKLSRTVIAADEIQRAVNRRNRAQIGEGGGRIGCKIFRAGRYKVVRIGDGVSLVRAADARSLMVELVAFSLKKCRVSSGSVGF